MDFCYFVFWELGKGVHIPETFKGNIISYSIFIPFILRTFCTIRIDLILFNMRKTITRTVIEKPRRNKYTRTLQWGFDLLCKNRFVDGSYCIACSYIQMLSLHYILIFIYFFFFYSRYYNNIRI